LDCNLGQKEEIIRLIQLNNEVQKMLNATIKTLYARQQSKTVRETPNPYSFNPYTPDSTTPDHSSLEETET
jgi:hypothetical protein